MAIENAIQLQFNAMSQALCGTNMYNFNIIGGDIDYSAAFQMSAVYMHQNIWREEFLDNLTEVGNFPENCRSVAVSMGAIGEGLGYADGVELLDYNKSLTMVDQYIPMPFGLSPWHLSWKPLSFNNTVNTTNGDNLGRTFHAGFSVQPFINMPITDLSMPWYYWQHDQLTAPSNTNLDNVPGAYMEMPIAWWNDEIREISVNIPIIIRFYIPFFGWITHTVHVSFTIEFTLSELFGPFNSQAYIENVNEPVFCFVPTPSALAVNGHDWHDDINTYGNYPHDQNLTPFNAICASEGNYFHANMPGNQNWEDDEVYQFLGEELYPENMYIQNRVFAQSYSNVFEAKTITLGKEVDVVQNRSLSGDVIAEETSRIEYRVPLESVIIIENGVDISGYHDFQLDPDLHFPNTMKSIDKKEFNDFKPKQKRIAKKDAEKSSGVTDLVIINTLKITDEHKQAKEQRFSKYSNADCKITVYPSPTKQRIKIKFNNGKHSGNMLVIRGIYGNGVMLKTNYQSDTSLDVLSLPTGIYIAEINIDGRKYQEKFVIL